MSDATVLKAQKRDVIGHANRKLRPEGLIPAVVYGAGRESMAVEVDRHEFDMYLTHHGAAGVMQLDLGESKPVNVLVKEVARGPIKGEVEHIDFLAVRMDKPIQATAPLHLVGDAAGVKEGGVLNVVVHELNLEALPADLPEAIEADVSELEIGGSFTVADVAAPKGVTLLDDPETLVATVNMPTVEVEPEEGAEGVEGEAAEPELIGEESDAEAAPEE